LPNTQPIEKRAPSTWNGSVDVHSIFLTIQGEGPFCGRPCVFVRLAGCNLQCPACDTEYTAGRRMMAPSEVVFEVNRLWRAERWRDEGLVVVTGGEPFRQELRGLFDMLNHQGYDVQVETNGTLAPTRLASYRPYVTSMAKGIQGRMPGVYVVCSPKTGKVHPDILEVACALKYVLEAGQVAEDGLPLHALQHPGRPARPPMGWDRPVYVQPMDAHDDGLNALHTRAAVASCLRHGHTLQLQVHKFIGVE